MGCQPGKLYDFNCTYSTLQRLLYFRQIVEALQRAKSDILIFRWADDLSYSKNICLRTYIPLLPILSTVVFETLQHE